MEETIKKPSEEKFNLSKVKLLPDGGLQATYQVTEEIGGELTITDYQATISRDIHPNLQGLFKDLRHVVARVFNITSFLPMLESDYFKLPESKLAKARSYADELISKISVRGVTWAGTGDKIGVVITSLFETPNGLKTCINTPCIKLANILFGFEEELETIAKAIQSEVYQFIFNGKQAQLSLFGDQPDNDEQQDNGDE